jgi:hypothetical protein
VPGGDRHPSQRERLRKDSAFYLEMSYCHDKGIPHSAFLSWAPEDRAKTLAYSLESAERCSLCGTAEWEWDEDPFAYEPIQKFCKGCYLRTAEQEEAKGSLPGTTVELAKVTPVMRAKQELAQQMRSSLSRE